VSFDISGGRALALLASVVLLCSSGVSSQGTKAAPPYGAINGAFLALSVANLDASVAWYTDKLGLSVSQREPKRDGAAFALLEGNGLIVELVQLDDAVAIDKVAPAARGRERVHGLFKAGAIVPDFDRLVATLKERGVDIAYGPFPKRGQQRANVIIRDHAGTMIQFFGQ
jgi:catechol 2,3-dioxygenase-like lactoylglutathione lyase family enzyme